MKLKAILLATTLVLASSAQAQIIGWIPQQMTEKEVIEAVTQNAQKYLTEVANCDMENIGFFEAVNTLKNFRGDPVLVILSEVELSGNKCELNKYADCRTVFYKDGDRWSHDITFCEKQDAAAKD